MSFRCFVFALCWRDRRWCFLPMLSAGLPVCFYPFSSSAKARMQSPGGPVNCTFTLLRMCPIYCWSTRACKGRMAMQNSPRIGFGIGGFSRVKVTVRVSVTLKAKTDKFYFHACTACVMLISTQKGKWVKLTNWSYLILGNELSTCCVFVMSHDIVTSHDTPTSHATQTWHQIAWRREFAWPVCQSGVWLLWWNL